MESLHSRYLAGKPAKKDQSLTAKGYFVNDSNANYIRERYTFGIIIKYFINIKWNETQFATTPRLYNDAAPVTEIHFTPPSTPFNTTGAFTV